MKLLSGGERKTKQTIGGVKLRGSFCWLYCIVLCCIVLYSVELYGMVSYRSIAGSRREEGMEWNGMK